MSSESQHGLQDIDKEEKEQALYVYKNWSYSLVEEGKGFELETL